MSKAKKGISLTDFVEIVSKSGRPKATKVLEVKNRDDYTPMKDFYKPFRKWVADVHKKGLPKSSLDDILSTSLDKKKRANYPTAVLGYKKWWGNRKLKWFTPPSASYSDGGVSVSINPEIGLYINDIPHIIKLYLKDEKLEKLKMDTITGLMEKTLQAKGPKGAIMCVLDVRNGKSFSFSGDKKLFEIIINGELAYITSLWNSA